MRAIVVKAEGGPEQLVVQEYPTPEPGADEILIRVVATALNRADILQRRGKYPPPPGASPLLGLEVAGTVWDKGCNVTEWEKGQKVYALLTGGGYAEYVVVHRRLAMPLPDRLSMMEASAVPEAFITSYQALFWLGQLEAGSNVLIHAGASGVGTAAIQIARDSGAVVHATAGSPEKLNFCLRLGVSTAINYKEADFADRVLQATDGKGADIIVDFIGAPYWAQNIRALALDGRIVVLATMGGSSVPDFDIRQLFQKRGSLMTSTLRTRSLEYRAYLSGEFRQYADARFNDGRLRPAVDRVFDWCDVVEAHRYMEENRNVGKIVLRMNDE